jgi:CBS domain-containing protein
MTIRTLLKKKGNVVITTDIFDLVRDAINVMVECKVAALVLTNGAKVIGVISERDILRAISDGGATILNAPVGHIVISELVTVSPEETIKCVMHLMTHSRIRHLLVMETGQPVGIVSVGDIVKYRLDDLEIESNVLRDLAIAVR